MTKKRSPVKVIERSKPRPKKYGFWMRIFRFFFPPDFKGELRKGLEVGKASGVARKIGGGLYEVGRFARRKVDPEHKMKIGEQRRKK